jgi:bifunctional UDP-N-acetylglucosamine pyrophosphorylase/glucosamine-1-phosphate N-acetyltransferase
MSVHVIILAAGEGTRMRSGRAKVLHEVAGRAMVNWAAAAAAGLGGSRIMVVVGHQAEAVAAALPVGLETVLQPEQLGTGHAAGLALAALDPADDDTIVVLPGDAPLVTADMLVDLVTGHGENAATLVTTHLDDPTGYGRVIRRDGSVAAVVEQPDASPSELAVSEVATSIYAFAAGRLRAALQRVEGNNAKGEYYLTDVIGLLAQDGEPIGGVAADLPVVGVNSFDQLAEAAAVIRVRINTEWMRRGVHMVDPATTYVDAAAVLAAGARIYPGVHIEGASTVATGAVVGPDVHVHDSHIGEGAAVRYSVVDSSEVQAGASVGPYAYLRQGTVLGPGTRAGTHVELKNAKLAAGAKVPHLSYIGDATVGEDANIGAGSITCNWDGYEKHRTTIGARARIGSDTMLVAPVEIGEDGWTGAGSVISSDVPPGALGVERSPQKEILGYADRRKKRAQGDE